MSLLMAASSQITEILEKKWVFIHETSSEPAVSLGILESSNYLTSYWLSELTAYLNPNNHTVGTMAAVTYDYTIFHVYQVQEG